MAMKVILLLLSVLTLLTVGITALTPVPPKSLVKGVNPSADDKDCSGKPDGIYQFPKHCKLLVICVKGTLVPCPKCEELGPKPCKATLNTVHDLKSEDCYWPDSACTSTNASPVWKGLHIGHIISLTLFIKLVCS